MTRPAPWTWSFILAACLVTGAAAAESPTRVLPPQSASFFQKLLPRSALTETLDIEILQDHAQYRFKRGGAVVEIEVREASACDKPAGPLCLRLLAARGPGADALAAEASEAMDRAARSTRQPSPWAPVQNDAHPPVPPAPQNGEPGWLQRQPGWLLAGQGFLVVVLAGVLLAALRWRRVLASRAAVVPGGLLLGALALRFAAHPIPADIRDVIDAGVHLQVRRAGWSCFVHLLFSVLPATHESVWGVHRVVGALAVPLLYLVMRRRFTDLAAAAAAATLAVLPLAARFSATDTPYVPLCTAFLGAIVALDVFARSGSRAALALGLGLLTCAMQLRPDGPWLVVPAALLFACHPLSSLARPSVLGLGAVFAAVNAPFSWWAFSGHKNTSQVAPSSLQDFVGVGALYGSPWFDREMSPWPLTVLVVLGAFVAVLALRPGWLWLVATVVAMPLNEPAIGQYANMRYHLPSIHLACGLAGLAVAALVGLPARLGRAPLPVPAAVALAVGIPVAAAAPRLNLLRRMWTPQLEFERFRAGVREIDPRCALVSLLHTSDAGLDPFTDPGALEMLEIPEYLARPRAGCVIYYRAANCFSPDALTRDARRDGPDECRAFEERTALTPISEWTLPAIPYRGERYTRDPLPIGFYRIGEPTPE